jgi:exoribonuclease-2
VRADTLPLVFRVGGAESLPRGAHVRARVVGTDLLTLDLHATLAARLDDVPADAAVAAEPDADELAESAGPLTLAIDVQGDDAADPAAAQTADTTTP